VTQFKPEIAIERKITGGGQRDIQRSTAGDDHIRPVAPVSAKVAVPPLNPRIPRGGPFGMINVVLCQRQCVRIINCHRRDGVTTTDRRGKGAGGML